ncbi:MULTISPECIES: RDD family protein [Vibrio]|uniref:RDD family protein n=1 Tax=Vibrio neptunius TaxID=170651 RepID=A0ABS3A5P1_9VIBR|nr:MULTISPECIES: RDD family protein [Vibrio]MBN3494958.1 RDD family protein [Vibrio neptunius]MBN3517378.1 RDD family protein [Vibrio neptunius]MBN3551798.1 RDD family protein [Vibrio neptunius]MBN3579790.1 RDD family protein [Vibrio neptunius]MCH9873456.1 RDD family protein [Vibrio neptunius]
MNDKLTEYAGFWIRFAASLIDTVLLFLLITPLMHWIYGEVYWNSDDFLLGGWDLVLNWVCPLIATVAFWVYRSATPGKMALKLEVLDADSGHRLTFSKSVLRYVAYYVSAIPLCLGFIWIAFSSKKQGWHDLIANTVVVRRVVEHTKQAEFLG